MQRPDNKLPFSEFSQEVFKAHRADRIEHPIPEVEEAAKAIRPFFDNMLQAQLKSGYIPNPTWATGHKARLTAELSEIRQQIQELQGNQSRSVNQEALLVKLNDHVKLVENELNEVTAMLYMWKAEPRTPEVGEQIDTGVSEIAISRPSVNDNITPGPKFEDSIIDAADLNKDADQYLFHGTNIQSNGGFESFVNPDGSLTLRATFQNVGKRTSVSFAPDVETATDYATRIKGAGPDAREFSGSGVFKIKKEYLPNLERQADDEFTINNDVTIPRDGWRFASLQDKEEVFANEFRQEINTVKTEINPKYENKTNKELMDIIHNNAWMVEVRESQGLYESGASEFGGKLGRPEDPYLIWLFEKYSRYVGDDIENIQAAKVLLSRNISDAEIDKIIKDKDGEVTVDYEMGPQNVVELKGVMQRFDNWGFFDAKTELKKLSDLYRSQEVPSLPPVLEKPIGADVAMPRQAANANFEPYTGPEKFYLPRIFLPEQVAAKADTVRKTMIDWYSNPENYPDV